MGWERARGFVPLSLVYGRTGRRLRRALAAALFLAAAALAVVDGAAAEPSGTPTVVATRQLPSGSTVRPSDLRIVRFPQRLRPDGAFTARGKVTGRTLSGAAAAGEPITAAGLLGEQPSRAGTSTVPIRLADPGVAHLLEPGTKVDVVTLAAESEQGRVLAGGVTVLTVTEDRSAGGANRSDDGGPLVLLAVPGDTATGLAAAALNQPVTVTLD